MSYELKKELFDHLANDAGVAALVGSRIFHGNAPRDASRPFVHLELKGLDPIWHLQGRADKQVSTVAIRCYDDRDDSAWDVHLAVKAALDDIGHADVGVGVSAIAVRYLKLTTEEDDVVFESDGGEIAAYVAEGLYEIGWVTS